MRTFKIYLLIILSALGFVFLNQATALCAAIGSAILAAASVCWYLTLKN